MAKENRKPSDAARTVYLFDGSAYIHRAYHAIRGLTNSKGLPTNAVFGFTRTLMKLFQERSPLYGAVLYDARGPTFRHEIYDDYKANRPPMPEDLSVQIPYIKQVIAAFNIPAFEVAGYEADDLIGTLARKAEEAGFSVVIVTGDKDFIQMVSEKTTIWDPMKDKVIDMGTVQETFGVKPGAIVDVMALVGDATDNIPGVPGIGQKTALALIQAHGSLDGLFSNLQAIPQQKQRENLARNRELAFLSRKLAEIDIDAPVAFDPDALTIGKPDNSRLFKLFQDLEFRQLQEAFPEPTDLSHKKYLPVTNREDLAGLVRRLEASDRFAMAAIAGPGSPLKADLAGLAFAMDAHEAWYLPLRQADSMQVSALETLSFVKPVLEDPRIGKIGQDLKLFAMVLDRLGVSLSGPVFDTMIASYLIHPSKRAHGLDQIALDFLDHRMAPVEEAAGKNNDPGALPVEKAASIACEAADVTLMASGALQSEMEALGLVSLFQKVEMPLVPVLARMEKRGICVDTDRLRGLSKDFQGEMERMEDRIFSLAGEEFNIQSSQQLAQILFEKLRLPVQKKTRKKTGYSTDVDVLTALAAQHELPALILRHRSLAKLKSTYADALISLTDPQTGRIHTSFNQTATATGRLSSSDPNLQNIPIRTEEGRLIRSAFIPREGWHLVSADYSQIELRILAHCSEDPILIRAFAEDEDVHTRTASEVFNVFPSFVTPELRRQAKVINFGIIYGMGAFGLAQELGISQAMAKTIIDNYFKRYRGVKRFIDETLETVRRTQKTGTLLGRIRLLPEMESPNRTIRQFAERTAVNTPIQGTAADLIKVAMIRVDEELEKRGLRSAMLLSVHDELVFEVPPDEMETVSELVRKIMEGVWDLKVPLRVNITSGKNWAEAH